MTHQEKINEVLSPSVFAEYNFIPVQSRYTHLSYKHDPPKDPGVWCDMEIYSMIDISYSGWPGSEKISVRIYTVTNGGFAGVVDEQATVFKGNIENQEELRMIFKMVGPYDMIRNMINRVEEIEGK